MWFKNTLLPCLGVRVSLLASTSLGSSGCSHLVGTHGAPWSWWGCTHKLKCTPGGVGPPLPFPVLLSPSQRAGSSWHLTTLLCLVKAEVWCQWHDFLQCQNRFSLFLCLLQGPYLHITTFHASFVLLLRLTSASFQEFLCNSLVILCLVDVCLPC